MTTRQDSPARGRLSPDTVLDRALALADGEGLEAVTIRRLAQDLGVTPMALYWHFRTKDLLMDALVDRVIAEVELGVERSAPWIDQFRTLIEAVVRRLRAHPWVVSIFSPRTCESPRYLDALEALLDVLRRGGFSPREAAEVSLHAIRVSISLVGGQPGPGQSHDPEGLQDLQRRSRLVFETLPRDRYPRVIEAAQPLASCEDTDSYYGFGVDLLIRGVAATARISELS